MQLKYSQKNWNLFGKIDPLGAILTVKGKKWEWDEFFQTGEKEIADLIKHLASIKIDISKGKALDFGCGIGRLTQALASRFYETCGVDIAPSMIALAQKHNKFKDHCRYFVNKEDNLKIFPDKSFDLVLSKITLQHIHPDYGKKYIEEFVRIARPGGVVVFQMTSAPETPESSTKRFKRRIKNFLPARWLDVWHELKFRENPVTELYGIPPEKIQELLEKANVRLVDARQDQSTERWISWQYCAVV